jgi:hypothetical protein
MNKINLTKDETPSVRGKGFQESTNSFEFTPNQKRLATLRARAALAKYVLSSIEGDHGQTIYVFSRWALCRQLDSIDSAERWLDHVTGVKNHG